ncbi:nuclear transport factor 2 family protein [Tenacibaculum sp. MAR_2009_124]|uniref:nuclear transport factor 2 family protein n=1 Tax=Tenacibaculum sp. MAR_2009_124 TaxID=1250059 RepID=UPI001C40A696|nr:nuclear transport factor 2 family protein [Tenacibaculum sp. MAR_2009_124]
MDTEVYLVDIKKDENKTLKLSNPINISNNEGYDSQPYFYDENTIIFSSERDGYPDIRKYHLDSQQAFFINSTKLGGEYSPQRIPNSNDVSAVRLDSDGKQAIYKYDYVSGENTMLIKDFVVAYPTWYNKSTLISSVIINDSLHLYKSDVKKGKNYFITKQTGRSIHKIPNSKLISFTKRVGKSWQVWSLNPNSLKTEKIVNIDNSQDVCWLPNGILLIASGNRLLQFNPKKDTTPTLFHEFKNKIDNISRITVNNNGTKLAMVAEKSPETLAQEQLDAYNNRDIEAFLKPFANDVKIYTFPNTLDYIGKDEMRKRYGTKFKEVTDLNALVTSRVVKGNIVIDEELVTANGHKFTAVAIYEMNNGKITSVRFIR